MSELRSLILHLERPSNFSLILAAVSLVVEVYAPATRSPILIGQYANTKSSQMEHNDITEAILVGISSEVTIRVLLQSSIYESFAQEFLGFGKDMSNEEYFYRIFHKNDKAIWFVDSVSSFQRLIADLLNERFHYERNGFFCIIYTGRESKRYDILRTLFGQLFRIFVINVNILVVTGETVNVYTYFPFRPNKCSDTEPLLYDIFGPVTDFKFKQKRFFSKKLTNMWGCKIRVTTWHEPPFTIVKFDEHTGDLVSFGGIEGMLITLLASQMNFTMQFIEEPTQNRGYYYSNGTATGTSKMLIEGETDIVVVCLMYDMTRQEHSQPAYSYLSVPLNLGIPKGQLMTPFERLIRPFKYIIWSCFSTSVLFGILVIYLLKAIFSRRVQEFVFGHGNHFPFTNFLSVLYGGPIVGALPRRNFSRYFLAVWILYSWVLRSAYIGQLFLILQDSRGRTTLSMINEAVKRNFTFYTYPLLIPILRNSTSNQVTFKFVDNNENSLEKLFIRLGEEEDAKIAVTVLGHLLRFYNQNPENHKRRLNVLTEPILNAPITFYMQKHSFLAFEINDLIMNIMSSGLVRRFEEFYLNQHTLNEKQKPALLSLWVLMGLFSVYLFLLTLSFLVFLLELRSNRSVSTKKLIDFFNL